MTIDVKDNVTQIQITSRGILNAPATLNFCDSQFTDVIGRKLVATLSGQISVETKEDC